MILEDLITNVLNGDCTWAIGCDDSVINILLELGILRKVSENGIETYQLSELGKKLYEVLRKLHDFTSSNVSEADNQRGNSSSLPRSVKAGLIT